MSLASLFANVGNRTFTPRVYERDRGVSGERSDAHEES